jgi:hypothetical protein
MDLFEALRELSKKRLRSVSSATTAFNSAFSLRNSITFVLSASRLVSALKRAFPASRNALL